MKVFGIAGYSGSGKTTLIEKLIPALKAHGIKVSVIKHAHHGFDIDRPGKDSYRQREAGASEVLLSCNARWALMHELRDAPEPTLDELLQHLSPCDLVLVEGFKQEPVPKLEVFRSDNAKPPLYPERPDIVALASDDAPATGLPVFALDDAAAMARFILNWLEIPHAEL
ncbi:MAG TPA: molybdopterin-guanine dinucleotide biosynthesis protein B [Rhodocyclaceae bacterium]|nr:molybdopterin-guanine dinucleotide biosynthesis protein B [Rhodocyclaceae bacterium]